MTFGALLLLATSARADGFAHEDLTLKNGLRVLLPPDRRAPTMTVTTDA
jgi:hypothetical protein